MKQFLLFLFSAFAMTACYDDLGNYNYTELNDVSIDSINSQQWYERYTYVDTLKIEPVLKLALGGTEEHLEFEWKLIPIHDRYNSDSIPVEEQQAGYLIGRERNLAYPLKEKPGDYAGFFYVKDTQTGISYKSDFYVRLRTSVSEGWMLLCEDAGKARLDVISYTGENEKLISHDLWNGLDFDLGKPHKLVYNYNWVRGSSRLLLCDAGTFNLDPETLQPSEENNMVWQFSESPEKVEIAGGASMWNSDPSREFVITSDGELYWRNRNDIPLGSIFTYPVNKLKGSDEYFKVSPCVGYKPHYDWASASRLTIFYDETNRRFLSLGSDVTTVYGEKRYTPQEYPTVLSFKGGTADYDANTGKDLVHMEGNKESYVFAVLKTPEKEEYYIYGMQTVQDYQAERTHYLPLIPANGDKITHFAFHPIYRVLFYATEQGDIYKFNFSEGEAGKKAEKILSFPGERISVMKFQCPAPMISHDPWEEARENWLYVASYDTTLEENVSGIFRMYDLPQLYSSLVLKQEIRNLGKIIDIAHRYKQDYPTKK